MLDQLTDLVRQHSGGILDNIPGFGNDKQTQVHEAAGSSIMEAMQQQAGGGGMSMITNLLQGGGGASSGLAGSLAGPAANLLAGKLGISPAIAQTAVAALLPKVLGSMAQKAQDPNDSSFTADGIMSALGGGNGQASGGGLAGMVGGLFN